MSEVDPRSTSVPTEQRHTPGPWSVEDPFDGQLDIVEANKPTHEWKFIATIHLRQGNDPDEFPHHVSEANARLIAAAPELLTMLKRALAFIGQTTEYKTGHTGANAIAAAGAMAVANAEGRS